MHQTTPELQAQISTKATPGTNRLLNRTHQGAITAVDKAVIGYTTPEIKAGCILVDDDELNKLPSRQAEASYLCPNLTGTRIYLYLCSIWWCDTRVSEKLVNGGVSKIWFQRAWILNDLQTKQLLYMTSKVKADIGIIPVRVTPAHHKATLLLDWHQ